jgi:transposase
MCRKNRLIYVDESGIDEYLHREHGKAIRGRQIIAEIPGKKFARQSIVAAKCGEEIIAPFGYEGTCNSELFLWWIKTMLIPKLRKRQIVIMDNASIHKNKEIQKAIEKAGCHLVYQPPYSPDLNPIEHFWSWLKRKIRSLKIKFSSLDDYIYCALS